MIPPIESLFYPNLYGFRSVWWNAQAWNHVSLLLYYSRSYWLWCLNSREQGCKISSRRQRAWSNTYYFLLITASLHAIAMEMIGGWIDPHSPPCQRLSLTISSQDSSSILRTSASRCSFSCHIIYHWFGLLYGLLGDMYVHSPDTRTHACATEQIEQAELFCAMW